MDGAGSPKSSVPGPSPESQGGADAAARTPSQGHVIGTSAPALTAPESDLRKGRDTPRVRIALAIAGGAALLGAVAALLAMAPAPKSSSHASQGVSAAKIAGTVAGSEAIFDDAGVDSSRDGSADAPEDPLRPAIWRVAQLADDASVTLVEGAFGTRSMLAALEAAGISRSEAYRLTKSLSEQRSVDRLGAKDSFVVARDKATGHVVAYEIASSPADVWQGREEPMRDGSKALLARKLELLVEPVRIRKAILVGADLRASLSEAGIGPVDEVLTMLDDALEGHAELADIRPGARIRIVGKQERVNGTFVRWLGLEAVEYFPAAPNAPSVRVYSFGAEEGSKRSHGWYDSKGRQPVHGGWRMPVPMARVASRFNPHRMHPVLHVIMPHNGVDFAAPAGAPVYATAGGVVTSVGFDGPCGNKVEIEHGHGMTSVYCHLSRFAQGLRVGQHVEQRQLIAYVGQTGRVTGPHLHFGMKRGDVFIDPLTLRLDGVRVVPRARRDEFDRTRADMDAELDAIALPVPPSPPAEAPEAETFFEEPP